MMRATFKKLSRTLVITLIALFGILFFLLGTPLGLHLSLAVTKKLIPATLQYEEATGTVLGTIHLTNAYYKDVDVTVKTEQISIKFQPLGLLIKRFTFKDVTAQHIEVTVHDDEPPNDKPIDLPVRFLFKHFDLSDIHVFIHDNPNPIEAHHLTGRLAIEPEELVLTDVTYQISSFRILASGTFNMNRPFVSKLKTQLMVMEGESASFLSDVNIHGKLDEYLVSGHITNPLTTTFTGRMGYRDKKLYCALNWKDLNWSYQNGRTIQSPHGRLNAKGTIRRYEFNIRAPFVLPDITKGEALLAGTGTDNDINIETLKLSGFGGNLTGPTSLSWKEQFTWQAHWFHQNINLESIVPNITSTLKGEIITDGQLQDKDYLINITSRGLSGHINQHPLKGQTTCQITPNSYKFSDLDLQIGKNHLKGKGTLSDTYNIAWEFDSQDLNVLVSTLNGSLHTSGTFKGTLAHPKIQFKASGHDFSYDKLGMENYHIDLAYSETKPSHLQFEAKRLFKQSLSLYNTSVNAKGHFDKHDITLTTTIKEQPFQTQLTGSYQNERYDGTIQSLSLLSLANQMTLAKPAPFKLSKTEFHLPKLCLKGNKNQLCLEYSGNTDHENLTINASHLDLSLFNLVLPHYHQLTGKMNTKLSYQRKQSLLTFNIDGHVNEGTYHITAEDPTTIPFKSIHIKGLNQNKTFKGEVRADLHQGQQVTAIASSSQIDLKHLDSFLEKLTLNIKGNYHELHRYQSGVDLIRDIKGRLNADINLAHFSRAVPSVSGSIALIDGKLWLPTYGITVEDIQLAFMGSDNKHAKISGTARSGKGIINISGDTFFEQDGLESVIQLNGENIKAMKTREFDIDINPNLMLETNPTETIITGHIFVPRAKIHPVDFSSTHDLSDDVIFTDQPKDLIKQDQSKLYLNVDVELGPAIDIDVIGIRGRLNGNIQINDTFDRLLTATGELSIQDGYFVAFGQKLDIQHANLLFAASPIENPNISLSATKVIHSELVSSSLILQQHATLEALTIGMRLSGTVKNPEITLFSEPVTLSEPDILSYLLFNQPLRLDDEDSRNQLGRALAVFQLNSLTEKTIDNVFKRIGVDDFRIESKQHYRTKSIKDDDASLEEKELTERTSIVVGKSLTNKLFISYSLDFHEFLNTIKLIYRLSRKWSVEVQTNEKDRGGNILYTFEAG